MNDVMYLGTARLRDPANCHIELTDATKHNGTKTHHRAYVCEELLQRIVGSCIDSLLDLFEGRVRGVILSHEQATSGAFKVQPSEPSEHR